MKLGVGGCSTVIRTQNEVKMGGEGVDSFITNSLKTRTNEVRGGWVFYSDWNAMWTSDML